jgi:hypothetical protein
MFFFLIASALGGESWQPKKYYNNSSSSLMGFILLNHSRILHEINYGDGDFVRSVLSEKDGKLSLDTLRTISSNIDDPYQFAKVISEF